MRMKNHELRRGAFAGLVATIPMTLTMEALRMWLPQEQARRMPPREVIDRTVNKSGEGHAVDERERAALTAIGHLAFGAAAGALFGAAFAEKSERASVLAGIAYGLTVWAVAYGVGLPSLGLHPAAPKDTADRNQVLIASHVVWGATLGRLARRQ
jgi:uncharacterized membrane protein YagU involved in acid resistance